MKILELVLMHLMWFVPCSYVIHTLVARPYYLRAICKADSVGVVMKVVMSGNRVNNRPTYDTTVRYAGRNILIKDVRSLYSIGSAVYIKFNPFDMNICYIGKGTSEVLSHA